MREFYEKYKKQLLTGILALGIVFQLGGVYVGYKVYSDIKKTRVFVGKLYNYVKELNDIDAKMIKLVSNNSNYIIQIDKKIKKLEPARHRSVTGSDPSEQ